MKQNSDSLSQFGTQLQNFLNAKHSFAPFASNTNGGILESTTKYYVQDLIGEGPLAGLVDPNGNELILFDEGQNNSEIFKGIYLNDYSIKNNITNTYNYNRLEIFSRAGTEFQSALSADGGSIWSTFSFANPGVSYAIDKSLYGLPEAANVTTFSSSQTHASKLRIVRGGLPIVSNPSQSTVSATQKQPFFTNSTLAPKFQQNSNSNPANQQSAQQSTEAFNISAFSDFNFQSCFGAYHEIKDVNTDFLILSLKIQALYIFDKKGNTRPNSVNFGIKIGYKLREDYACYIVHRVTGIASSPYEFNLFFDVSDFDFSLGPYIKVFNLDQKVGATENKVGKVIGVSSVTEITSLKFRYPNSCYFLSVFDARGFTQPPNRQFDFKLLKIKVPENYDAESKTYDGFWNGEFDSVLRWTDNPAWILYDLITNYRYGLGKFSFQESLADKWSMYKIAKYCDELVSTENVSKYKPVKINNIFKNKITVQSIPSDKAVDFKAYFPIGSKIDLVNLAFISKDEDGTPTTEYKSFKKIVVAVTPASDNKSATIQLVNEFGIHRICSLFPSVKEFLKTNTKYENRYTQSLNALITAVSSPANVSSSANVGSANNVALTEFISYIKTQSCFSEEELKTHINNTGTAASEFKGFLPLLEPRFRANISLSNETDVINLLNNIASVFKGLVYWSNNFVNFDNDRPKSPSYFFNNSNVKDGIFQYSSSSKDTRYTVAKITYSDENNNFKDQTVYVEDQINIRRYGYVEKEIIGFGVTSKSQAKRIGQWFLVTNQIEQELVSFTAGPEALLLLPGNVISITDEIKVSGRKGGRVVSVSNEDIVLDDRYDFIGANDTIAFIIPNSSISPSVLNKESEESKNGISDSRINELSSTYIYKFTVQSVGLDGNFRTKIVLNINNLTDQEKSLIQTIGASTLWIYDSKYESALAYSKNYRIVSIKEKTQTEFEIAAAEYEVTKFGFVENNKNLAPSILFSNEQINSTDIVPTNILASSDTPIDVIKEGFVSDTSRNFNINDKYDYLIPSFDYSDNSYNTISNVVEIFNSAIYAFATQRSAFSNEIKAQIKGLVIEYVLNSKKIAYVWRDGDSNSTTIALPQTEMDLSFESLRVYIIGKNDNFLI